MVNSLEFKKDLRKEFNLDSICIYNPLNKNQILKSSREKSKNYFKEKKIKNIEYWTFY